MVMWKLRGCPRCGGDVFSADDVDGRYQECLQCSYRRDQVGAVEPDRMPGGGISTAVAEEASFGRGRRVMTQQRGL